MDSDFVVIDRLGQWPQVGSVLDPREYMEGRVVMRTEGERGGRDIQMSSCGVDILHNLLGFALNPN
jgi:hypothetical protein